MSACEICGKVFQYASSLNRHIKDVHMEQDRDTTEITKIQCQICGKHYSSAKNLKDHTKDAHMSEQVQCAICLKWLSPRRLSEHTSRVHLDNNRSCFKEIAPLPTRHSVDKVDNSAISSQTFAHHVKCEVCDLTFPKPRDLGKHIKDYHSGSRGTITFRLEHTPQQ